MTLMDVLRTAIFALRGNWMRATSGRWRHTTRPADRLLRVDDRRRRQSSAPVGKLQADRRLMRQPLSPQGPAS